MTYTAEEIRALAASRYGAALPREIRELLGAQTCTANDVGMSDSLVFMFDAMVLKVQPRSEETDNEAAMLHWLRGRIPAPELLAYACDGNTAFTLMTRMHGMMLCDPSLMANPEKLVAIAAEGLRLLRSVDISDCPCTASRLENRLREARRIVAEGKVDVDNTEPGTWEAFAGPEELLRWLETHRPPEDLVLTHGDYCLPNILTDGEHVTGFIDLGKAGPADRWQDLALCLRSMGSNFDGRYNGGVPIPGYRPEMLMARLGQSPDPEKQRYYLLLDELF